MIGLSEASWPDGRYCLPMPRSQKCPSGWHKGVREHDTEDSDGSCCCSRKRHGWVPYNKNLCRNLGWGFCCKTHTNYPATGKTWPKGSYCIFRYGGSCPKDFHQGYLHWDDEDSRNANARSGVLPDGSYGRNTKIFFCCRNDPIRSSLHQLVFSSLHFLKDVLKLDDDMIKRIKRKLTCVKDLPKCPEIILMRYKGTCPKPPPNYQRALTGFLQWDTEDRNNADQRIGVFPDGAKTFGSGIKIEFCSYTSNAKNC